MSGNVQEVQSAIAYMGVITRHVTVNRGQKGEVGLKTPVDPVSHGDSRPLRRSVSSACVNGMGVFLTHFSPPVSEGEKWTLDHPVVM